MVDLDRCDARTGLCQRHGERAQPRPDLDDVISGADIGESSDLAYDVRVDDEVLAEVAARRQTVFAEQRPDVVARMHAYQLMRTGTGT